MSFLCMYREIQTIVDKKVDAYFPQPIMSLIKFLPVECNSLFFNKSIHASGSQSFFRFSLDKYVQAPANTHVLLSANFCRIVCNQRRAATLVRPPSEKTRMKSKSP